MKANTGAKKKWVVSDALTAHRKEVQKIAAELNILPVTAALLYNRGYRTPESAYRFLNTEKSGLSDPFLLADMDRAVGRIINAIGNGERIRIYGDYDVDGVTSVSILYLYLKAKGADVDYYIPSRDCEGYGVNCSAIKSFADDGVKLIVTVDTGITAVREAEYAASLDMDMIITDHHECHSDIPEAVAVVNPRRPDSSYPFRDMAGVGVVFRLICALEKTLSSDAGYLNNLFENYADLVAIGTIADVMPLTDENRLIVSKGLKIIERSMRPGLDALLRTASKSGDRNRRISSSLIGFVIAPRINAAGRLTKATRAVELFLTQSKNEAAEIARELCETNSKRQAFEQKIIDGAYEKIMSEHDFENERVIVLAQDNWHHGVIGIVASRITERFGLPSILISFDGDTGKGSGRSVKGLNLVDALRECADLLLKYGGHELAAGLTIERGRLDEFKRRINEYAARTMPQDTALTVAVETVMTAADLTLRQASEIRMLEPYGVANPVPVFLLCGAELISVEPVGDRHTRFQIKTGGVVYNAIFFGSDIRRLGLYAGDMADLVFSLDINEYQNTQSVQLVIRDIRLSTDIYDLLNIQKKRYNELVKGEPAGPDEDVIPARKDFSDVFHYIKNVIAQGRNEISIREICINKNGINYIKARFIIDIFSETGILISECIGEDLYRITLNRLRNKVDLEKSGIYSRLRHG